MVTKQLLAKSWQKHRQLSEDASTNCAQYLIRRFQQHLCMAKESTGYQVRK